MIFLLALACWGSELSVWASRQPNPPVPPVAESYEFTGAFFSSLAAAAAERPGVVQVEKIGESVAGRPIWAFHVGEPGWPVEHRVLIFAGIHALEWIGTETAVAYLHELIARPVRRTRVTVIPLLNPDGRAKVEADLMVGNNTYRRGNHRNVDLNRDFAVNRDAVAIWKAIIPGYYSTSPEALSQPDITDPFTGRPFLFTKNAGGWVLYSVGSDLSDDGGDDRKDIAARYPPPQPKPFAVK